MQGLLKVCGAVDRLSRAMGWVGMFCVLATTLISAGNALVRKGFDISSNSLLEIQWYLFAAVFMLASGYAFLQNSHVRIDFVSGRLSARARNWIDVVGILAVLVPFCVICIYLSWPLFTQAWTSGEMSQNAGGLVRWPAYLLMPVGFGLLLLQGLSELVKRIAFLRGEGPDTLAHAESPQDMMVHDEAVHAAERK